MKRFFLILCGIFLLFNTSEVFASIVINEVQTRGTGANDEFIELFNSGTTTVDLTDWYINKISSTGNETTFVSASRLKDKSILANSYFIIGRDGEYQGSTDATWANSYSLSDQENSLVLYNPLSKVEQVSWSSILEGQTFQRQSDSTWQSLSPGTPKANNVIYNSSNGASTPTTSEATTSSASNTPVKLEAKTKIVYVNPVFPKIPVEFRAETNSPNSTFYGKYVWNFGDGVGVETRPFESTIVRHVFYYEGDYLVTLQYFENQYQQKPTSTDRTLVRVVPANIFISNIGPIDDFFIEIMNSTDTEVDLSGWRIKTESKIFIFPLNTILSSGKKIIIPPQVSGFDFNDRGHLALYNNQDLEIFRYLEKINPEVALRVASTKTESKTTITNISNENNGEIVENPDNNGEEPNIPQQALSVDSMEAPDSSFVYVLGLFLFLIISGGGLYFIRARSRTATQMTPGDDFEIIDE